MRTKRTSVIVAMLMAVIVVSTICTGASSKKMITNGIKMVRCEIVDSMFFRNIERIVNKTDKRNAPYLNLLIAQKGPKVDDDSFYYWFEKTNLNLGAPMIIRIFGYDELDEFDEGKGFVKYKRHTYLFSLPLINSGIVGQGDTVTVRVKPGDRKNLFRWLDHDYIWREPDGTMRKSDYGRVGRNDSIYILDVPYRAYKDEESHVKRFTDGIYEDEDTLWMQPVEREELFR